MRLLQQKLGWIRGSNSAESYTGKPLQASHHFTAVQTKQWKIIHNIKNKNHKSLCSYYALEIRAINPFLYDPYLFFNSCPPPFFPQCERRETPRTATVRGTLEYHTSRLPSPCWDYLLFKTTSERSCRLRQTASQWLPFPRAEALLPN